jgi:peptidoglycan-associated lipoprotein
VASTRRLVKFGKFVNSWLKIFYDMKRILYITLAFTLLYTLGCTYTIKIKDGKTAFDRKQYAVATNLLQKEYGKAKTKSEKGKLAFQLAESYRQLHNDSKAAPWYKTAFDDGFGVDALREQAYCLKRQEQYKEAAEAFKQLGIEIGSPYEYRREITACNVAGGWIVDAQYSGYKVETTNFNSANADYAPTMYEGGKVVISSDRQASTGDALYSWTGNRYADLFVIENNNATSFDKEVNTSFNEAAATFNKDFTEMFFVRSGGEQVEEQFTKIFYSKKISGTWTTPEVLPFCKEKVNYSTPSVSSDGKTLFFASNDSEGWGGQDIYVCTRGSEGFAEPKILNRSINSVGNEAYPSIDGDTLYFASDYHTGMGGWDVFKSYRMNDNNWSPPQNLKFPINSGADDFGLTIDNQSALTEGVFQQGYFTSNRIGGKGSDDVYKFQRGTKPAPIVYKNILDVIVLEKIYASSDNPNSKVIGKKPLTESKISITVGGKKREMTVNTEGVATIELEDNADYNFFGSKEGYLNNQVNFSSKGLAKDPANPIQKFEVEITLDKIFKNKEISLENIYYDLAKWDIRSDAQPTLNKLAETLMQNPQVKIQLSSHTDCRSSDTYNATLSQKRAESAVNYLISKGLDPLRLIAKGYGESQPAISCECNKCTEGEHQANRRTTFKVLE